MMQEARADRYQRYHIETAPAPDLARWPGRFKVKVGKLGLARLLLRELIQYRGDLDVVLSRPCLYGVFSGPLGGFTPREERCVGCLRCTTQYPEFVQVLPNPQRRQLGDSYFTHSYVNAISYEASTGRIPVKGAGYRGRFGGEGWDSMWTDMSEIVRPTRDGIHGREFISTVVDIGARPKFLTFAGNGHPDGARPSTFPISLPIMFDVLPDFVEIKPLQKAIAKTAAEVDSVAILPVELCLDLDHEGRHLAPLVSPDSLHLLEQLPFSPRLIELRGWSVEAHRRLLAQFPDAQLSVRTDFGDIHALLDMVDQGIRTFHLTANYQGRGPDGAFVYDLIRETHLAFVDAGCRDQVTFIGSGGIIAAEHVAKAIIAGLDAVALDTPVLIALQAILEGEYIAPGQGRCSLPEDLDFAWSCQRLMNMLAAWRDQLLEVLGAMGLREVRRLRGEIGRAMLQMDLEREAFAGIEGFNG